VSKLNLTVHLCPPRDTQRFKLRGQNGSRRGRRIDDCSPSSGLWDAEGGDDPEFSIRRKCLL